MNELEDRGEALLRSRPAAGEAVAGKQAGGATERILLATAGEQLALDARTRALAKLAEGLAYALVVGDGDVTKPQEI